MNRESETLDIRLRHPKADAIIQKLPEGRHRISIQKHDPDFFVRWLECETSYPVDLIEEIFAAKGPGWLIDEIARDESPEYTGAALKWKLLSYVANEKFLGARILDFGCGSGGSTANLARMFPQATIVGIELEEPLLAIARSRARHYELTNVEFHLSPTPETLPVSLGEFEHVVMTGVFEHLLPQERLNLLPQLWSVLKPGGTLFLHETPYRYFPIETHTTGGVPLINQMPRGWVLPLARKFSPRNLAADSWDTLLRKGIRGGTIPEIMKILPTATGQPKLLQPSRLGINDRIDLWYVSVDKTRHAAAKKLVRGSLKLLKTLLGLEMVPYLELAIRKSDASDAQPSV